VQESPVTPRESDAVDLTASQIKAEVPESPSVTVAKEPAEVPQLREPLAPKPVEIPGLSPQSVKVSGQGNNITTISLIEDTPSITPESAELIGDIRSEFRDFPELGTVLEKFVLDTKHPMNIVGYMKNREMRPAIFDELKTMAKLPSVSSGDLKETVARTFDPSKPLLKSDDAEFSVADGQKRSQALKEDLLKRDGALYSMGDVPTDEQSQALKAYAGKIRKDTLPKLVDKLESIIADMPKDKGFPAVNARAKTAEGIVDKIHRMRVGNDGKDPRPDYALCDMPDAVGGRITVNTPEELQKVMQRLESSFGNENIFEKDNFYSNPKKNQRAYRVITYTVQVDGVPCEVQVTTLRSSMAADLNHNTAYKRLHPDLPESTIDYISGLQRNVAADEHRDL
jgi:ppGpp synthetase/RelA/SpoT-type nucleotidyltranferase